MTRFDTNHSTIGFTVPILGGASEVEGRFRVFTITLAYDAEVEARSQVEVVIRTDSIDTGIADRDADLRSDNFFDAERFPEIRFRSTLVEPAAAEGRFVLRGELTMREVTRSIDIPILLAVDSTEPGHLLFSVRGDLELDRDDWGITWRHPKEAFVGDRVAIRLRLLTKLIPLPAPDGAPPPP